MAKETMKEVNQVSKQDSIDTQVPGNPILENYPRILQRFRQGSVPGATPHVAPLVDSHGFFVGGSDQLYSRIGGLDKLFHTLIQGVIDDPDYAIKKDSRIYERMERDPQIWYCLNVRKLATSSLPWIIKPPASKSRDATALKLASEANKRFEKIPNVDILFENILNGLLSGLSVNELVWEVEKDQYLIKRHYPMNKDRFKFDKDGGLRMLDKSHPVYGKPMPDYKFIVQAFHMRDGSWSIPSDAGYLYYGRGLADTPLYHYFYFKVTALKFYLQSLERYGAPAKILYTGKGQNVALANRLHEIMLALKQDSVITIPGSPEEIKVEMLQTRASGMRNVFIDFLRYIDILITRCILGQELMTEMSTTHGSYAATQVHKSVFNWVSSSDKVHLVETMNRTVMRYDANLNTPDIDEEMRPLFDFKPSTVEDILPFLQSVESAQAIGLAVSERQVRELTGLREPLEGEAILEAPQPMMDPMGGLETNGESNGKSKSNLRRGSSAKRGGNGKIRDKKGTEMPQGRRTVIDQPKKSDKRRIIGK